MINRESYYTSSEVAKLLGVTRPTVLRWILKGSIPPKFCAKIGSLTFIQKDYIAEKLENIEKNMIITFP